MDLVIWVLANVPRTFRILVPTSSTVSMQVCMESMQCGNAVPQALLFLIVNEAQLVSRPRILENKSFIVPMIALPFCKGQCY